MRLKRLVAESAAMQGRREKQEDRHVKIPDFTKAAKALKMPIDHLEQPCAFFAVYDGHQGHLCAEFAAKGFHLKLLKRLSAERSSSTWTDEHLRDALREVCLELDAEFLAKFRTAPDGCTVVASLVTGSRLHVAWVGDSRCLLCRHSSQGDVATVALTEDHRPSLKAEAERVRSAGGSVVNFDGALRVAHRGYEERVREIRRAQAQGLGTIGKEPVALAVSRSLGDRHFKAVTGKELLVATPGVRTVQLNKSTKFVALMCDGILDVMRNEEAVYELDFARGKQDDAAAGARAACGALVQEAYKRGSGDNLTVIFVQVELEDASSADGKRVSSSDSGAAEAKRPRTGTAVPGSGERHTADMKNLPRGSKVLGAGHFKFRAQAFWQEVLPEQVALPGLEFRLSVGGGRRNLARLPGGTDAMELLPDNDPRLLEAAVCSAEGHDDEAEVAAAVRRTASWGDPVKVRRLIASCSAPQTACAGAVCEAAKQGHEEVVRELLRARALPSSAEASSGRTALHWACQNGHEGVARFLLEAKADLLAKDSAGRTPCDLARDHDLGIMAKRLEALVPSANGASNSSTPS